MMSVLHLLWIVPLSVYTGMFAMGLLFAAKDDTLPPNPTNRTDNE